MVWVEKSLKSKKPSQRARVGSPGICPLKPGRDPTDGQCQKRIYILQTHHAALADRGVFPSIIQQGMHSGTSAAPTEGKAPLAAIWRVTHEQGYSPGTDKGDSQLYSPVVNLAEAAASLLLCGVYTMSQSCLLLATENLTEDRETSSLHWPALSRNLILLNMVRDSLIIVQKTC